MDVGRGGGHQALHEVVVRGVFQECARSVEGVGGYVAKEEFMLVCLGEVPPAQYSCAVP